MVKDTYTFKSGYTIKMSLTDNPNKINYCFMNDEGYEVQTITSSLPTHHSKRSGFITQVKNCVGETISQKDLDKILIQLNKIIQDLQSDKEAKYMQEQQDINLQIRRKSHEAKKFVQELNQPLLYIGSIIDWLTAGERTNTLICFIAGCSQIILKEPISVIGYGEASSGKTFIQQTSLSLLPDEFIEYEKQVSAAALFNRASLDSNFYDGKIVVYGDMGGQNDREGMQQSMDLMKELQTEGFLKKPVSVKSDEGKWTVADLILEGRPAVWYTTVPTMIDKQEESRAILYTPRTNNRLIFNKRNNMITLKGKTYLKFKKIETEVEKVQHIVLHLREVMEDYVVIDPFYSIIADLLSKSKFYKRDVGKYLNLLNAITVINFYQNKKAVVDGQKVLITSKNDVQLLLTLLANYIPSIAVNIKPKSVEIYQILCDKIDEWKLYKGADEDGYNNNGFKVGITVADYFERSDKDIPLSSLRMYFQDLREAGLLTVVGKEGRANQYDVVDYDFHNSLHELDFTEIIENVEYELGEEIAEIVRKDSVDKDLSIMDKHNSVEDCAW